ncbi:MAG: recX [Candidatus Doudnabacteria bacterium]|nr:recX [Candidatus Doudnabacteria bacterium]
MIEANQFKKKRSFKNISCKDYALFLVSLRAQSIGQMRTKLAKKGYPEDEIEAAIQRLSELNYLNDEQFAQIYLDNLKKYKNFGYFGIKKKLMEKKINSKQIEALLKSFTLKEETEIARRLIEKNPRKNRIQIVRALQSKGFRTDVVFKITKFVPED